MKTIITVQNLTIGYKTAKKELAIIQDINFELTTNNLYALIGKNGSGKSTLIRTLANLQEKLSGTININGKPLADYTNNELAKLISIVTTEKIPTSNFTVYELVALGRQPYSNWLGKLTQTDKNIIATALQETDTRSLETQKLNTLSDGQLQKVLIARAIAQDTPIILLDEPTTHLDMENKVAILLLLKKLSKTKTILVSTHEINTILPLTTELLIAKRGNIISINTTDKSCENTLKTLFSDKYLTFDTKRQLFFVKKQ